MTKRTFIFDSDGGVDDAQALIMLVANGKVPDIVTTVFGNVGLDQATTNLLAVLAMLEVDVPVHKGAALPMVQPIIDAKYVHGDDGLGGVASSSLLPKRLPSVSLILPATRSSVNSFSEASLRL